MPRTKRGAADGKASLYKISEREFMGLTNDPDTWPGGDGPSTVARPLKFSDIWLAACEGCGAIYDLLPSGDAQLRSR